MESGRTILIFSLLAVLDVGFSTDVPCSAKEAEYGYVCVCNSTYCDTVETPSALPKGSYYLYTTSETSPGFTKTQGTFFNTTVFSETASNSSDVYFWVNSSAHYQTFLGMGAGITDSAGINFNYLPDAAKQKLIESYFGKDGLEYVFGRVPIAATDFSLRFYTYDDVPGDIDLKHFNLTEEDYTLKMPLIKMAMNASRRGLKLVATPWTAPSWMKTNNDSGYGYLLNKYHHAWARYQMKFLKAYGENGIDFWGLSQGNEVVLGFEARFQMPNMMMLAAQMKYWTQNFIGPMLKESPFSYVKMLTLDDERTFVSWWVNRIFGDELTAHYIDGIALHWYMDSSSNTNVLDESHEAYPDKFILYTESSIQGGVSLGDWDNAEKYINSIFQNYDHWVVGYMDWNIALNADGGPTGQNGMQLDSPVIVNATSGEFYKQPMFYAIGHFSKFISPGSVRIGVKSNQNSTSIQEKKSRQHYDSHSAPEPTGGPGPTGQPGPGPTGHPGPSPSSTSIMGMATLNEDGSHTFIVYNPKSDPINVIVVDPDVGTLKQTVQANSLNTFVYWLK